MLGRPESANRPMTGIKKNPESAHVYPVTFKDQDNERRIE